MDRLEGGAVRSRNATVSNRIARAEGLFEEAQAYEARGELEAAYARFTEGHDLIVDCPRMHVVAHRHLLRVNRALGRREALTDRLLLLFAPLGVFELVAFFQRRSVFVPAACARP
jgi:hypothetical protein